MPPNLFLPLILLISTLSNIICSNGQSLLKQFSQQVQIIIDYGSGSILHHLVYGIKNQLYVDIGAYDPIYQSNTIQLEINGWYGVNVEPKPERIHKFFEKRSKQINLNIAIGDSNSFVYLTGQQNQDMSPSFSLRQLCQKYYKKRPLLINIQAKEMAPKILQGNSWNNPKCLPDIFIIAKGDNNNNEESAVWGVMSNKNYFILHSNWEQYVIYIKKNSIESYQMNYVKAIQQISKKNHIKFTDLLDFISKVINQEIDYIPSNKIINNDNNAYLYLAKHNQLINVQQLIENLFYHPSYYSQYIQQYKNFTWANTKSIVISNFNIDTNLLIVNQCNFKIEEIELDTKIMRIFNITMEYFYEEIINIYIYIVSLSNDGKGKSPKIVIMGQKCKYNEVEGSFMSIGMLDNNKIIFCVGSLFLILLCLIFRRIFGKNSSNNPIVQQSQQIMGIYKTQIHDN